MIDLTPIKENLIDNYGVDAILNSKDYKTMSTGHIAHIDTLVCAFAHLRKQDKHRNYLTDDGVDASAAIEQAFTEIQREWLGDD